MSERKRKKEDPKKHAARNYRFEQAHLVQVKLALNDNTDKDILDFLETVPSKRGFILEAIRKAMAEQKKNPE